MVLIGIWRFLHDAPDNAESPNYFAHEYLGFDIKLSFINISRDIDIFLETYNSIRWIVNFIYNTRCIISSNFIWLIYNVIKWSTGTVKYSMITIKCSSNIRGELNILLHESHNLATGVLYNTFSYYFQVDTFLLPHNIPTCLKFKKKEIPQYVVFL